MPEIAYPGKELEVFATAGRWKAYWSGLIRRHLRGDVLEVGAGIGANTRLLRSEEQHRWVCMEPDRDLAEALRSALEQDGLYDRCEIVVGALADLDDAEMFDAILYVDVIEHLPDDAAEMRRAADHLKPGGRLIVLAPAHRWLYTSFDRAIGHHRRYAKAGLAQIVPEELAQISLIYLDSAGVTASLANRCLLRQDMPTLKQIAFWDRWLVPLSRVFDPLLGHRCGKTILGVWERRS